MRRLLFKVIRPSDGHKYLVYDNGEAEGFEGGSLIFNFYPALVRAERLKLIARQRAAPQSPELDGSMEQPRKR